ncbi:hypothetical protein EXS72_00765 [Candidatus Pacearchaeota archaeon]|nr:hypothetical protein [Candidatus Pacearchaeota archaeon]
MNHNRSEYPDRIINTDRGTERDRIGLIGRINHGGTISLRGESSTSKKGLIGDWQVHGEYFLMSENQLYESVSPQPILENIFGENPKDSQVKRNFILRSAIICFLHTTLQNSVCTNIEREQERETKRERNLRIPIVYQGNLPQLKEDFTKYLEERVKENRYS